MTNVLPATIQTPRQALTSMCYREIRPGVWTKPVGYALYSYVEERGEWGVWFASAADGETLCWTTVEISLSASGAEFLDHLKSHENYTGRIFQTPSSFEIIDVNLLLMV